MRCYAVQIKKGKVSEALGQSKRPLAKGPLASYARRLKLACVPGYHRVCE